MHRRLDRLTALSAALAEDMVNLHDIDSNNMYNMIQTIIFPCDRVNPINRLERAEDQERRTHGKKKETQKRRIDRISV